MVPSHMSRPLLYLPDVTCPIPASIMLFWFHPTVYSPPVSYLHVTLYPMYTIRAWNRVLEPFQDHSLLMPCCIVLLSSVSSLLQCAYGWDPCTLDLRLSLFQLFPSSSCHPVSAFLVFGHSPDTYRWGYGVPKPWLYLPNHGLRAQPLPLLIG